MSPTRTKTGGSLWYTETVGEIRRRAAIGGAGTAPGRTDPWVRHASFPGRRETVSIAMTRVNNGKSVAYI